jgi:hypothetical protein
MSRVNIDEKSLLEVMIDASQKDTCWPGCADQWSPENRPWGHCAMYALEYDSVLWEEGVNDRSMAQCQAVTPAGSFLHLVNIVSGKIMDMSGSQFKSGVSYEGVKPITRDELLAWPDGEAERYALFHRRVCELRKQKGI